MAKVTQTAQFTNTVTALVEEGITSSTHHATLRRLVRDRTGQELDRDGLAAFREALDQAHAENAEADAPTPWTLEDYLAHRPQYTHVVEIAETSERTGKPTRVVIVCQNDGCDGRRECATQDAFQVKKCWTCRTGNRKRRSNKGGDDG